MTTSEQATLKHIRRVQELLSDVSRRIVQRALVHDESKLCEPEASLFEEFTPKLAASTYGSEEYEGFRKAMGPALDHHYAHNAHHPEHWPNGIRDMSLIDLIEMLVDWKAAGERHANGSIEASLKTNQQRFKYGDELASILARTALELWPPCYAVWHCFGCGAGGMQGNFCERCGAGRKDFERAT